MFDYYIAHTYYVLFDFAQQFVESATSGLSFPCMYGKFKKKKERTEQTLSIRNVKNESKAP